MAWKKKSGLHNLYCQYKLNFKTTAQMNNRLPYQMYVYKINLIEHQNSIINAQKLNGDMVLVSLKYLFLYSVLNFELRLFLFVYKNSNKLVICF